VVVVVVVVAVVVVAVVVVVVVEAVVVVVVVVAVVVVVVVVVALHDCCLCFSSGWMYPDGHGLQIASAYMLPADAAYSLMLQKDRGLHVGAFALSWKLTPSVHFTQTRSDVPAAKLSATYPAGQVRKPAHSRSEVGVGATSSYCVLVHSVVV
jgi:hypothetical protein